MDASISQQMKLRLDEKTMQRSFTSSIIHLILNLIFLITMDLQFLIQEGYGLVLIANFITFVVRMAAAKRYLNNLTLESTPKKQMIRWLHNSAIIVISLLWPWFVYGVLKYYGPTHYFSLLVIITIVGVLSGAPFSMGTVPWLRMAFTFIMLGGTTVAFINFSTDPNKWGFVVMSVIFFLHLYKQASHYYEEERRSIGRELSAVQELLSMQALFDSMPGFIMYYDEALKAKLFSQGVRRELGISMSTNDVLDPNQHQVFLDMVEFLRLGIATQSIEVSYPTASGTKWYLLTIQRLEGGVRGVVAIGQPIDELVQVRSRLELETSKSQYAARLAAMGEMAAGVAHEVNNPLAIIMGCLANIESELKKDIKQPPWIDKFKILKETVGRISKIVKGLITFSRDGSEDPHEIRDVSTVVTQALDLCQERFVRHSIAFEVDRIPEVYISERGHQLSQVLYNLLLNAVDAVMTTADEKKWIKMEFQTTDHFVFIRIIDAGNGVPDGIKEKIFTPFFTTKSQQKSVGLGLSVSRSILLDHKGDLFLDPYAQHTAFVVKLPISFRA